MVFAARDGAAAAVRGARAGRGASSTGLDADAARALLAGRLGGTPADEVVASAHRGDARQPAGPARAARRAHRGPARGSAAAAGQLHLTDAGRAGLPRPEPPTAGAGAARCCCSRPPTTPARPDVLRDARRAPGTRRARAASRAWTPGCWSHDRRRGRAEAPSRALGDLPGRRRARTGGEHTGPWPTRSPASGTPTARSGTAPSPPSGPDADLVAPSSALGARARRRGGYVAALAAYERAAALSTDAGAAAAPDVRGRTQRLGVRAGGTRTGPARRGARGGTEDPLLLCDIARLRGHIEVNIGSAAGGAPDLRRGRARGASMPTLSGPWRSASPRR